MINSPQNQRLLHPISDQSCRCIWLFKRRQMPCPYNNFQFRMWNHSGKELMARYG
jgi:hypothetical protein